MLRVDSRELGTRHPPLTAAPRTSTPASAKLAFELSGSTDATCSIAQDG